VTPAAPEALRYSRGTSQLPSPAQGRQLQSSASSRLPLRPGPGSLLSSSRSRPMPRRATSQQSRYKKMAMAAQASPGPFIKRGAAVFAELISSFLLFSALGQAPEHCLAAILQTLLAHIRCWESSRQTAALRTPPGGPGKLGTEPGTWNYRGHSHRLSNAWGPA